MDNAIEHFQNLSIQPKKSTFLFSEFGKVLSKHTLKAEVIPLSDLIVKEYLLKDTICQPELIFEMEENHCGENDDEEEKISPPS